MDVIFCFVVLIVLWIASIFLLSPSKLFYKFIFWNLLIAIIYFCVILFAGDFFWGHDKYGLGTIFRLIFAVFTHTIIGFIFAIFTDYKLRKK